MLALCMHCHVPFIYHICTLVCTMQQVCRHICVLHDVVCDLYHVLCVCTLSIYLLCILHVSCVMYACNVYVSYTCAVLLCCTCVLYMYLHVLQHAYMCYLVCSNVMCLIAMYALCTYFCVCVLCLHVCVLYVINTYITCAVFTYIHVDFCCICVCMCALCSRNSCTDEHICVQVCHRISLYLGDLHLPQVPVALGTLAYLQQDSG